MSADKAPEMSPFMQGFYAFVYANKMGQMLRDDPPKHKDKHLYNIYIPSSSYPKMKQQDTNELKTIVDFGHHK